MPALVQTVFEPAVLDAETCQSQIKTAVAFIQKQLPTNIPAPTTAIICGSGLGKLCELLAKPIEIPYESIPGFVKSTVQGHAGKLVFGMLGNQTVICMVGRFHKYEGYTMAQVTFPVRVFAAMKIKLLVVTNAAGGINPAYRVGDMVVLEDHMGIPLLAGNNPLVGPNLAELGPRFPSMSDMYSFPLRRFVFETGRALGMEGKMHSGIYCYVSGPQYETRTEVRFLKSVGVDAVGMSTVPEVVVARHAGMQVLGLSLITNAINCAREPSPQTVAAAPKVTVTHEEVLQAGADFAKDVLALVREVLMTVPEALISDAP